MTNFMFIVIVVIVLAVIVLFGTVQQLEKKRSFTIGHLPATQRFLENEQQLKAIYIIPERKL